LKYLKVLNLTDNDIIWVEALPEKVDKIKKKPNIIILNECISDKDDDDDDIIFHVTNNYESSSILKLKNHLIEHPHIHQIYELPMKTKTLRTLYNENNILSYKYNFMNLDIQGAELKALKGCN